MIKSKIFFSFMAFMLFSLMHSCKKEKADNAVVPEVNTAQGETVYVVDTLRSSIEWKGYKIFKSENTSHFGNLLFERGEMSVKEGRLQSGIFVAHIASLSNEDLEDDAVQKEKLEKHLLSPDFFHAEKFPTATYEITQVSDGTGDYNTILDGKLTIKGVTRPLRINANVSVKEDKITLFSEPTDFSRSDFSIRFQSPIENGVIQDEINIQIVVSGIKK